MENLGFVIISTTALIAGAVLILNWIRGRHRIAEIRAGANGRLDSGREIEALGRENDALRGKVARLEERLAVVERIVTDPAERTALEIEQLRGNRLLEERA